MIDPTKTTAENAAQVGDRVLHNHSPSVLRLTGATCPCFPTCKEMSGVVVEVRPSGDVRLERGDGFWDFRVWTTR